MCGGEVVDRWDMYARFAQYAYEYPFAAQARGEEACGYNARIIFQGRKHAGKFRESGIDGFSTVVGGEMRDKLLVLNGVEGACGVDQIAARAQCFPYVA